MFLKHIDLTTALRPSYLPDEVLLFVQDNVGLYEGKFKLPNQQNGQVYLTSHRVCYVDKKEPRANSVTLDLKDVDRYEFYAGFLKSSAKVTLFPKPLNKRASLHSRAVSKAATPSRNGTASPGSSDSPFSEPSNITTATWVCTICTFSNPVPSNFDPTSASAHTPLPPCLACGIKPTLTHVLKAAISNANNRPTPTPAPSNSPALPLRPIPPETRPLSENLIDLPPTDSSLSSSSTIINSTDSEATFHCPRCTFSNHPSLLACEMCGAPLISQDLPTSIQNSPASDLNRTESPGPTLDQSKKPTSGGIDVSESVKISFRSGGEKIFYERLKGSMTQRKWLLQNAPAAPKTNRMLNEGNGNGPPGGVAGERTKTAGIAGLEQLGMNMRKNNELLIGSAFEDLEALMASAKDVIALAERFARQTGGSAGASAEENAILAESASQLGLITTKDIVGGGSSESLYLSELARNLAEFLTDDSRGVLKKAGGIITLVDLWAMFNRARGGVELVSPNDFEKAARLWEKLKLPVRLRTFKSGVMVVQSRDKRDSQTVKAIVAWLDDLHEFPPDRDVLWDWHEFGRGVTAQEAAERFGWSLGVAEEELRMAEERGALCREDGLEGLKFWKNYINAEGIKKPKSKARQENEHIMKALKNSGLI
ncbi:Fc.00g092060.m01.CDS01 [Cosmosporella sp. VM-42]